ncbi:natural killer cell receptor 2B4 [Dipodomys merriami]|uniref:natural killer cell receptor 2B4 n=1 Tax=Dipodomys merriami TaxID=94247 RepID=UPI0038557E4A
MLGQVVTLTLLLLLKGQQGQECPDSTDNYVVCLAGKPVKLRPPKPQTKTKMYSVEWKLQRPVNSSAILTWKNNSIQMLSYDTRFGFDNEDLTLLIERAKPQDSGLYKMEVTEDSGHICTVSFNVSVLDHVEKPQLWAQWKALDEGICQVALSCLVPRDDYVSYTWYRGSEVIATQKNHTYVEEQIHVSGPHTYTCNVSNPVSWDSHSFNLTQGCLGDSLTSRFLLFLVIILVLIILFVGSLSGWYVWEQKKKQSQTRSQRILTVYEDVKDLQVTRNQKQNEEQKSPGEESTIYSMVELQCSASTSQETTKTLYSMIHHSRKKRNHSSSGTCTIYEEVGNQCPKDHNPS